MLIPPPFLTFASPPGISVLCPTYGRAKRLPGLVDCFIKQDYPGNHELLILNDRSDQLFSVESSSKAIFVLNQSTRYPTLGDKRNALVSSAQYEYICWWDDDDRYLKDHLTKQMAWIRQGYQGSVQSHIWVDNGTNKLLLDRPNSPFATAVVSKKAILDVGGFPSLQMKQDIQLMRALTRKRCFWGETATGSPTCIYKKPGTSEHAHAGDYKDPSNNIGAAEFMKNDVDTRIQKGLEPSGPILIRPKADCDYEALCAAAWAAVR